MNAIAPIETRLSRQAVRVRNQSLALQLSAAAMEGDEARVKHLLAELLRCHARRSDTRFRVQLEALEDLFHTMRSMAMTDDLTGLNNRRGFLRMGARLLDVAGHERHNVRLVHVDLDNLKYVNDRSGHFAGDILLRRTADVLRDIFPNYDVYDVLGRLGGDEFAVLSLTRDDITPNAMRLRIMEAVDAVNSSDDFPQLSLSVGIAGFNAHHPVAITELLERAEQAMYQHKLTKVHRDDRRARSDDRDARSLVAASP